METTTRAGRATDFDILRVVVDSLPRVGVIGGGQLARMMQSGAIELGFDLRLLAEGPDVSAAGAVVRTRVGDYRDEQTVRAFAADCDVVTFDHEHVPPAVLRALEADGKGVRPGPDALIHAQDKAVMRERLTAMGLPCPAWRVVATPEELAAFGDEHGWPLIAKVSRGGYDGRGVWRRDSRADDLAEPFADLAEHAVVVAEEFVDFARELSVIVVRSASGQAASYPVSETVQEDGICVETVTPAPGLADEQAAELQAHGLRLAEELGVVGVLAVELMQRRDGSVVVNELAMRPHNTGHWATDGAVTSQFENHLRAVADLPLGSTHARAAVTVMHNVLGGERDGFVDGLGHALANDPGVKLHWYGKSHQPGRKLGHVTVCGDDVDEVRARARRAAAWLRGEGE